MRKDLDKYIKSALQGEVLICEKEIVRPKAEPILVREILLTPKTMPRPQLDVQSESVRTVEHRSVFPQLCRA
jgi:hypothetical protein